MDVPLQNVYRSCSSHLGREFLGELLEASTRYRRAVGFFSSSVFGVSTDSWLDFFNRGGTIQLVCCPQLSAKDIGALGRGLYQRPQVRGSINIQALTSSDLQNPSDQAEFLAALISYDRLEVKIALREHNFGHEIYHEKIAVFSDESANHVVAIGSANESRSAYVGNFERLDIFASFAETGDRRRAHNIERQFDELWLNQTVGVEVLSLDLAIRKKLLVEAAVSGNSGAEVKPSEEREGVAVNPPPEALRPASGIVPRRHQNEAIRAWAKAGGQGILEMATGSGKTITAMTLVSRFYDAQGGPLVILVVAPLIHLVDQWRSICCAFGLDPVRCAEGTATWHGELSAGIDSINGGLLDLLSIVTSSATLATDSFQRQLASIRVPLILVADEVHNYGAPAAFRALPQRAIAKVGLSATPERARDEAGNRRLTEFFGGTVYKYDLRDALNDRVLCPYRYHPQIVVFEPAESDSYNELSLRISKLMAGESDAGSSISEALKRLLIRRARLVATARGKLPLLKSLLSPLRRSSHILVYCGDGRVDGPDDGELVRQIDEAVRIIGVELGMACARYTAETPASRRKELIEQFDRGDIQVLVAIRCLDEGVDVPSTRTAFMLASSTNPRQFVQRRGRVLRNSPGKQRAHVYDFFVTMSPDEVQAGHKMFKSARSLLRSQLQRVNEFTDLAENGLSARGVLLDLRDHFNLLAEG